MPCSTSQTGTPCTDSAGRPYAFEPQKSSPEAAGHKLLKLHQGHIAEIEYHSMYHNGCFAPRYQIRRNQDTNSKSCGGQKRRATSTICLLERKHRAKADVSHDAHHTMISLHFRNTTVKNSESAEHWHNAGCNPRPHAGGSPVLIEKQSRVWQVAPCSQGAEGTPGCQKGHPTSSGTNKMSRGRRCVFWTEYKIFITAAMSTWKSYFRTMG